MAPEAIERYPMHANESDNTTAGVRLSAESEALRKAAVLIASLPLDEASYLTRNLDPVRLERLADAIAYAEEVCPQTQRQVARELHCPRAVEPAISPETWEIAMHREKLNALDPATIAMLLRNELPQTAAIVLAQMAPSPAAQVLRRLTTDQQLKTVQRMARIKEPAGSVILKLLKTIDQCVQFRARPMRPAPGGEACLAEILQQSDQATRRALIENLSEEDRPLVDRLLQRIHVLNDSRRHSKAG